jgi:hypothetical protein
MHPVRHCTARDANDRAGNRTPTVGFDDHAADLQCAWCGRPRRARITRWPFSNDGWRRLVTQEHIAL